MANRCVSLALVLVVTTASRAAADPPERVARVSFLSGTVSFRTAAATEWTPAALNYPVTIGDHLWTDRTGRVELQLGATAVDTDAFSAASVLNLDHQIVQLRLTQGSMIARVHELASDESVEIDTPNSAISVLRPGVYRIDVASSGDATTVTVRRGDADIAAGSSAFPVHAGQSAAITGLDAPTHALRAPVGLDEFEDWVTFRDRRVETPVAVRYMPRAIVGYEDLDEFGAWRVVADYGPVWVPHVRAEWVPYRFGHWMWIEPWGWTWIDDAPWGFAPFHYGRWAYVADGWVWVPGAIVARPVYSPALVAFVGGSNWRVGLNIAQPVGWFPLGPREVFMPAYQVSPAYVVALNRPHVAVTNVTVNVTNVTYVNRGVAGAVTVVPRDVFAQARPIAPAAVAVQPTAARAAAVVGHTAPHDIAAVAVRPVAAPPPAPPAATINRSVIVRMPPAAIVPSAAVRPATTAAATRPSPDRMPAPRSEPSTATTRATPPINATRAAPDRAAADVVTRHAQERVDIEARHAAERADLEARHLAEVRRATGARAEAETRARHERERADLEVRQKREHAQLQERHEAERRRPGGD